MSDVEQAVNDAIMYIGQIEEEFVSLIMSYNIGGDKKNGIEAKVAGMKATLDVIAEVTKEKPVEPEPIPEPEPTPPPEPEPEPESEPDISKPRRGRKPKEK